MSKTTGAPEHAEELAARYQEERDLRARASRDYAMLTGSLARYLDDPHTPAVPRQPVSRNADVLIVGGGMTGLLVASNLRRQGISDIVIIDSAGDFGGVWYWNRYPGAMCDVESYVYMPLLEELEYIPTAKYAHADEIFAYLQRIGRHFSLYKDALFQTTVEDTSWDDARRRWGVETDRGDTIRAKYLVLANGYLANPQIPSIPGINDFGGTSFHSSRWNYAYTGGGNHGDLDKLADKVVAVVGTAATAIQCIPHLGAAAKQLYVFQRTPSTVGVRGNRPTDPDWAANLRPGWQAERQLNFAKLIEGHRVGDDLVKDGWTRASGRLRARVSEDGTSPISKEEREEADVQLMDEIRQRIDEIVKDPETAAKLKPYYAYFCKRPGFHDEYLPTFNRPNVTLVDTRGKGPERIVDNGIYANGTLYEVDCLIFATGFSATATTPRTLFPVIGRNHVSLNDKWSRGVSTLNGLFSEGFPNLFIVPFPYSGHGAVPVNYTHFAINIAETIGYAVRELESRGISSFDVEHEAEAAWVRRIIELNPNDPEYMKACTPGRDNNEGRVDDVPKQNANYGAGALAYFDVLARWRERGCLDGLVLE